MASGEKIKMFPGLSNDAQGGERWHIRVIRCEGGGVIPESGCTQVFALALCCLRQIANRCVAKRCSGICEDGHTLHALLMPHPSLDFLCLVS